MRYVAILILVITLAYSVLEMNKISSIIKSEEFKQLNSSTKQKVVSIIKGFWKNAIIIISLTVGFVFIMISQFMGTHNYENIVSIITVCYCLISCFIIMMNSKNSRNKIKEFINC